ncbi:MAG TPA: hypothetical protein VGN83_00840 [Falsiroseomonas sp.]|nr:hypothetical protein [Falsiroseomonas sp.]
MSFNRPAAHGIPDSPRAIRVGRKLKAADVIDVLSDLFILRVQSAIPVPPPPDLARQAAATA